MRRWALAGSAVALAAVLSACNPGSYPVDLFSEMHYSPSQRLLQPNRLAAPDDAVPVNGGRVEVTYDQARSLANPVASSNSALAVGKRVYDVNCSMCHGQSLHGDGPVAPFFKAPGPNVVPVPPPDLTSARVVSLSDGELYWKITYGQGNMPAFHDLLTDQDVWSLVAYMREVQGRR